MPDLPAPSEYLPLLEEVFENGWYSNFGPLVLRLEDRLLKTFGAAGESCVTCCNATAGLSAALLATGRVGSVLLPAFTFPASLGAVRAAGMTPIVADVDEDSWILGGELLDKALAQTGASIAMLTAPFGISRNWESDLAICRKRGVAVVIDNASGLGGPRVAKGFGEGIFEVFSMQATKPFAVGEGGVVFAHSSHDAALRAVLNFALHSHAEPDGPFWGFNGKMSEFHAAVGLAQLKRIRKLVRQRQEFAAVYCDRLAPYPEIVHPRDMNCAPWQFFPILLPSEKVAERFLETAAAVGVEIRRYYRPSLSRWPKSLCLHACPVAEDLSERMCVLPVRALTFDAQGSEIVDLVCDALHQALSKR